MKICILTPRFPFPEYAGDVLRINAVARYLKSRGHTLVLVSLSDNDRPHVREAQMLYDSVYYVKRGRCASMLYSLWYMLQLRPMQCGYYHSRAFSKLLENIVRKESPDLYISHLLRMTPYLEALGVRDKSIVEMTDALSKTYTLSSIAHGVGLLKYVYMVERHLIARYEVHVADTFPKSVLVSQADVDYVKKRTSPTAHVVLHSNGVDIPARSVIEYSRHKICFVGSMRSIQNQDAVIFFAKEVFPLIKRECPEAKFSVIGSLPPQRILDLVSDDIEVTGYVDKLEPVVEECCLSVAPIRIAAGIQNKVLVSMSCGVPVVLSSLVSKPMPQLRHGENCMICDTAEEYAKCCLSLLNDPQLRAALSAAGREMVVKHFSWEEMLRDYEVL